MVNMRTLSRSKLILPPHLHGRFFAPLRMTEGRDVHKYKRRDVGIAPFIFMYDSEINLPPLVGNGSKPFRFAEAATVGAALAPPVSNRNARHSNRAVAVSAQTQNLSF